ncbi:hypothetical protein SLEP1_g33397 [Rubroshorea leprosula]|uniref:Transposase MuDR plant domain-containing protein n=1 Tax=Rubroshorea leprosula TaxID=152421 RepID=A0AAV5KGI4_9ROSI|nr:hypothetical protein SLEP1_g33397 [Rubroshorea leprosula]
MDPNDPKIVDVNLEPSEENLDNEVEHDSGNEAQTKSIPISIYLGGRDKLTLFELYTKIGIARYDVDMVNQICHLEPRKTLTDGLKPIKNDDDIRDVLGLLKVEKKVESRVENDLVEVKGRVEDVGHAIEVEGKAKDAGHAIEVEGKVEDIGNDGNDGTSLEIPSSSTSHNDFGPKYSLGSDDDINFISISEQDGSEVEHTRKRKGRHKVFSKIYDDMAYIELGMVFLNKAQFKKAVDKLSIIQRRPIKWVKNDKKRHRVICKERYCDWKILLAWDKTTKTWMVKTFNNEHTCE